MGTDIRANAPLNSPHFTGIPTSPTAAPGTNTTQVSTTAFVVSTLALAVTGLLEFQGNLDASANPNYPAASKGDLYYVSVAGKVGGASGTSVDFGDAVIAKADNAGGTQAAVGTSWFILEHNLAGALLSASNLSDLTSIPTARTNLGLGTGDSPQFTNLEVGNASDTTLSRSGAGVLAVEGIVIPTVSSSNTFTNKRQQPRTFSTTSASTLTPEVDTYNIFHLTALAASLTIANHSTSTPADGEKIIIRLLDNGTARALSFGTNYVAKGGFALPTTTVLSKNLALGFEWNTNLGKYNLLGVAQEA